MPTEPPVDVQSVVRQLGAREIRVVPNLPFDGQIIWRRGHTIVEVAAKTGYARRRFTIAHEAGHLYVSARGLRAELGDAEEEAFCDAFAEALLMPRPWVIGWAQDAISTDLDTLGAFAKQADVSISASLVRLTRVARWRRAMLRWRHDAGTWRLFASIGVPLAWDRRVVTTQRTRQSLNYVANQRPARVDGYLWLRVAAHDARVRCELSVNGASAIALCDFQDIVFPPKTTDPRDCHETLVSNPRSHASTAEAETADPSDARQRWHRNGRAVPDRGRG